MTREEIYALIQAHPVFHLATVEGDQPRVRAMLIYQADDNSTCFCPLYQTEHLLISELHNGF